MLNDAISSAYISLQRASMNTVADTGASNTTVTISTALVAPTPIAPRGAQVSTCVCMARASPPAAVSAMLENTDATRVAFCIAVVPLQMGV